MADDQHKTEAGTPGQAGGSGNAAGGQDGFSAFPTKQEQIDVQMKQASELHPFNQARLDQYYKDYVNQPETGSLRGNLSRGFYGQAGFFSRGKKLSPLWFLGPFGATLVVGGYLLLGWIFEPDPPERSRNERAEAANPFGVTPEDDVATPSGGVPINFGGEGAEGGGATGDPNGGAGGNGGDGGAGGGAEAAAVREPFILTNHNTVYFGHYPHYTSPASGTAMEDFYNEYMYNRDSWADTAADSDLIEWIILEDRDDSLLLMSKYVLDVVPMGGALGLCYYTTVEDDENYAAYDAYYGDGSAVTWENTKLRAWLNNEFYDFAFTDEEKQIMLEMSVDAGGPAAGMCNDMVTIPSSANLDKYMPHTGSGDYNFELVAEGTQYALYEQYKVFCGPQRETNQGAASTGLRVLVRKYHGHGYDWAGITLNSDAAIDAGCPTSLQGRRTVSYWLRDVDMQYYTGSTDYAEISTSGKEGIWRVVTGDGRYWTLGTGRTQASGEYPFSNEANMKDGVEFFTALAGIRPIVLIAKRDFVFGTPRGGELGYTGRPESGPPAYSGTTTTQAPPPTEEQYTIEFLPGGGHGDMPPVTVSAGPYTLPACAFTKRGYHFIGWDLGDPGDVINVSSNICVFAQWEKDEESAGSGHTYYFGHYEQDGNTSNGLEPIEWEVLADNGNTVLLISTCILDHPTYNEDFSRNEDTNWENCSLRTWLNDDFLNTAFTSAEQSHIRTRKITSDANTDSQASSSPGGNTRDQVSILSLSELYEYYDNDTFVTSGKDLYSPLFMARPTDAMLRSGSNSNGVTASTINGSASDKDFYRQNGYSDELMRMECYDWWLRTPGLEGCNTLYVGYDGGVGRTGMHVLQEPKVSPGVRPVIEVDASVIENASGINR